MSLGSGGKALLGEGSKSGIKCSQKPRACSAITTGQPLQVVQLAKHQRAVRDASGKADQIIWSTLNLLCDQRLNSDSHEIGIFYRHRDAHGFNAWKLLMVGIEDQGHILCQI
jgi:hypothetical protein